MPVDYIMTWPKPTVRRNYGSCMYLILNLVADVYPIFGPRSLNC